MAGSRANQRFKHELEEGERPVEEKINEYFRWLRGDTVNIPVCNTPLERGGSEFRDRLSRMEWGAHFEVTDKFVDKNFTTVIMWLTATLTKK